MDDAERRERVYRWVQEHADRDHGGDWIAAAVALLDAVRIAEEHPDDPWALVTAQQRGRRPK
jgi:hypothetical protein